MTPVTQEMKLYVNKGKLLISIISYHIADGARTQLECMTCVQKAPGPKLNTGFLVGCGEGLTSY
jgi:hypothetical protein